MTTDKQKPYLQQYQNNEWEFVYPLVIDNKIVYNKYWEGVELLNYDDKKAEKIFKGLISKYPYYIDAYNHLSIAFRNQNKTFESLLTAEKSYKLGKECFPPEFDFKKDKLIWSLLENRPFLRACQTYGLECQYHKDYSTAIDIYTENLRLNESDNQGIRCLLLETYFTTKDFKQVRKLFDIYSDEWTIEFKFGLVTLDVIEGNIKQADKNLNEAIKTNKFFIEEVIKDKHVSSPPLRITGEPNYDLGIPLGSVQQAYYYWKRNRELYKTKKVIEYYKERKKIYA